MKLFYFSTDNKLVTNKKETTYSKEYLMRKEKMVLKDFDTAFNCYDHLNKKIISLRQWEVTIMIALMVLFMSNNISCIAIFILVSIAGSLISILELRELGSMQYDKKQILYLEKIFSNPNVDEYWDAIYNYEFRDLRLNKMKFTRKILQSIKCLQKPDFIFWRLVWISIWIVLICLKLIPFFLNLDILNRCSWDIVSCIL